MEEGLSEVRMEVKSSIVVIGTVGIAGKIVISL